MRTRSKSTESKLANRLKAELLKKIEETMEKDDVSQGEVARRMGAHRYNVNKMIRQKSVASMELILKMAEALRLQIELRVRKLKD